jgi:membrane protein YdbS with pleckstrin-like domain
MFSYPNLWVMISAILLALSVIIGGIYFVNKMFVDQTKDVLVRFIILVFTALVCLFIVDKVIAFRIKLLTEENNNQLFELIKTLILMIFSYYFGTKNNSQEKE